MQNDELKSVIKDLNTYHEEKERKYFEKSLFKQKLTKYMLFFAILLLIVTLVLILILFPEDNTYTNVTEATINFISSMNIG